MAFNEYTFPNGQDQIPFQRIPLASNKPQLSTGFTLVFAGDFNEITRLLCEICGSFIKDDTRECEIHVRTFHGMLKDSPYTFLCDTCDSAFDCIIEATDHHDSHLPRPQCDCCDRNFERFDELNYHEVEDHQLSIKKTYQCEQYGNYSGGSVMLREHKLMYNKGHHCCNKCHSVFQSGYLLYEHSANCQGGANLNTITSSNVQMLDDFSIHSIDRPRRQQSTVI